jgi:hypothetical protein
MTKDKETPAIPSTERTVLVFLRAPEKGKVKTRLNQGLNPSIVLSLYKSFVRDTLNTIQKSGYPARLCYTPKNQKLAITEWLGPGFRYYAQQGKTLGERMANAFERAFQDSVKAALLIGTDTPQLPSRFIHDAFAALKEHHAVVGPSDDGGYYLIGFRHDSFRKLFFDLSCWGTDRVYGDTIAVLVRHGLRVHALPFLRDIDHLEDLRHVAAQKYQKGIYTTACLKKYRIFEFTPDKE